MKLKVLLLPQKTRNKMLRNLFPKLKCLSAKIVIIHAKKEKYLKNHLLTKHEHHQCKECQEKLPNVMQLLKHIADNHNKDQSVTKDIQFNLEEVVSKDLKERDELDRRTRRRAKFLEEGTIVKVIRQRNT